MVKFFFFFLFCTFFFFTDQYKTVAWEGEFDTLLVDGKQLNKEEKKKRIAFERKKISGSKYFIEFLARSIVFDTF